MEEDMQSIIPNLLSRKYLIAIFIWLLLVSVERCTGQAVAEGGRKDILAEMSQSERKEHIQQLLDSGSPNDQAWGAYWAAQYRMVDFTPQLIRLVDPIPSKQQNALQFRDLAMFDALIQLNASVPYKQLMPLYDRYPDHVLILLAKLPKENLQAIFEVAQTAMRGGIYWMTACNLLEAAKAPGFAFWLLKGIWIEVDISVGDKMGIPAMLIIEEFGKKVYPLPGRPLPPDLPPINNYRLTQAGNEASSIVAAGGVTIYCTKESYYPGPGTPQIDKDAKVDASYSVLRPRMPIDYLNGLTAAGKEFRTHYSFNIVWENPQQYSKEINRICNEVHSPFKPILNNLLSSGWLSESEAETAGINVIFKFTDLRGDTSVALPPVSPSCERIKVSK
jgi:hypothetical protein